MSLVITPGGSGGLQPDDFTLGKMFQDAVYATTYIGKWHLGGETQSQPQNQGFDQWLLGFRGTTDTVAYGASMRSVGAPEALQKAFEAHVLEAKGISNPVLSFDEIGLEARPSLVGLVPA